METSMTSRPFEPGDLIRRRGGRHIWRVILVTDTQRGTGRGGSLHARCDDKPGVTRVILRQEEYERVEAEQ